VRSQLDDALALTLAWLHGRGLSLRQPRSSAARPRRGDDAPPSQDFQPSGF
jgi:hypothetical protein